MKILVPFCLAIAIQSDAQIRVDGRYADHFGCSLVIRSDSTFHFEAAFDMSSSWTNGKWKMIGNTLYLQPVLAFDTVKYIDNATKALIDTLILSPDATPKLITSPFDSRLFGQLSSCGQNRIAVPEKLYFKQGRLFGIDKNGKRIKKKQKPWQSKRKYAPYFARQ